MLPLVGYVDRFSVAPGERIEFKVSGTASEPYTARLVRVICGDPNPAGPGIKEIDVPSELDGSYPSRQQAVHLGSYARIPESDHLNGLTRFTFAATIWPALLSGGRQAVLAKYDPEGRRGAALVVDHGGSAAVVIGDGDREHVVSVGKQLRERAWYRIYATYGADTGALTVGQTPLSSVHGVDDEGSASTTVHGSPATDTAAPLLIAAMGGDPASCHFNGKIESPEIVANGETVLRIDFSREISSTRIVDVGPHELHGELVNMPARAMTGSNWTGAEMCWRHAPEQYGAIHFHADDIYDCAWETDFAFTVPDDMRSGVYAARLTCGEDEDMIPFFVRPARGTRQSNVCVLVPTFTYIVYGNNARNNTDDAYRQRAASWNARQSTPDDHPDYGVSTYNFHPDGSGVGYGSRLRPIITMRSGFITFPEARGSGLRHFAADTHLYDWLDAKGHEYDVVTDEDLDAEGVELIGDYDVVMTASHPEYHTARTLDALAAYTETGGRLMYMGGNGFYWRVALDPEHEGVVEIRRAETGIRAWAAEPGEYYNSFDGTYGGLWRRNGRPPQELVGVGFSAQGTFEGSYYRRQPDADDPRAAWIFEGVDDEVLGDFGLSGGGAAGFELDRVDHRLGTPLHALVLATSEGHSNNFVLVPEEILSHTRTWPLVPTAELIRADMAYFETPNGGAVFSVGSISFCGSLCHNGYDNNISRIVDNVLRRFMQPKP